MEREYQGKRGGQTEPNNVMILNHNLTASD